MDPDGGARQRITQHGDGDVRASQPRWTPDGNAIVYVQTPGSGYPRRLAAMRRDCGGDSVVLQARALYTHPCLQPAP
jgi:Tol biopolymer transport system component